MVNEMDNRSDAGDDTKYVVQILARALRVLWTLADRNDGWTLDDLAQRLDVNKASMLRILRTLEADRVVLREGDAYVLGPRVLELSHGYLRDLELDAVAKPFLQRLAAQTGQTVSLAVLDELDVVYIAIEKAHRELGIQGQIGGRHPANATALGKVLLADLGPDELTERLGDEERGIGIRCVAAPIRSADGRVIAAISVAGAIFHMSDDVFAQTTDRVLETAAAISSRFGYQTDTAPPVGAAR